MTRARASGEELWLNPNVPVVEVSKEFGTIIKQSTKFGQHKPCDWVNGRRKATGREGAALVHTTVGTDLGVGVFVMHPVCGGACVPSGQESGKVGVGLLNVVEHGTS